MPIHGLLETILSVLGGGQLGRLPYQTASQRVVKVVTIDLLENGPANAMSYNILLGVLMMVNQFVNLLEGGFLVNTWNRAWCRLLTVENEHMDVVTLEKLVQQGIDCQIKVSTIMIIQMPPGLPVATAAIGNAATGALLAESW